jgi:hypothetical protein
MQYSRGKHEKKKREKRVKKQRRNCTGLHGTEKVFVKNSFRGTSLHLRMFFGAFVPLSKQFWNAEILPTPSLSHYQ